MAIRGPEILFQSGGDRIEHPLLIRKLTGLELGKDQVPVEGNLEATASRRYQPQSLDLLLVGGQKLARQTDGLGFIVSNGTILDFHVHWLTSSGAVRSSETW